MRPDAADALSTTESRLRSALGVLGGERLQRRGLELSADAYDAWKQALAPLNLALSVPQRLLRGADSPPSELELLAADRLASGHGSLSREAADLLEDVRRRSGAGTHDSRGWDDGFFVLPPAQTDYQSIHLSPILVTEWALRGVTREELGRAGVDLYVPSGLLLRPVEGGVGEAEIAFTRAQGLALTAALATGLEKAALRPLETPESELLVALRRLDQRLRDGSTLVVDPWTPSADVLAATTSHSIFQHAGTKRMQQVSIERNRDSVAVRRELVGQGQHCPDEALCIDRDRALTGNVYAVLEDDGSFRIGAHTRFDHLHFGLEMGSSGPRVSMTLPVGRWLGLGRWLPIEASLAASAEGIDAAPRLGERSAPEFSAAR